MLCAWVTLCFFCFPTQFFSDVVVRLVLFSVVKSPVNAVIHRAGTASRMTGNLSKCNFW